MSDKLLHNRLDSLFADLEEINELPAPSREHTGVEGWTFSCDSNKRYTDCSPEVEDVLGISAGNFIGESLTAFPMIGKSSVQLAAMLEKNKFPCDLEVEIQSNQGEIVLVRLQIHKNLAQNDGPAEYSGFTQVIERYPGQEEVPLAADKDPGDILEAAPVGPVPDGFGSLAPDILATDDFQEKEAVDQAAGDLPYHETLPETEAEIPEASFDPLESRFDPPPHGDPDPLPDKPESAIRANDSLLGLLNEETDPLETQAAEIYNRRDNKPTQKTDSSTDDLLDLSEPEEWEPAENPEEADEPVLKFLPDLTGAYPDAIPDAFTSHFTADEEEESVLDSITKPLDLSGPADSDLGLTVEPNQPSPGLWDTDNGGGEIHTEISDLVGSKAQRSDRLWSPDTTPLDLSGRQTEGATNEDSPSDDQLNNDDVPDPDGFVTGGGKTRPFDNLDALIATLPHTVSGAEPLGDTDPLAEDSDSVQNLQLSKGTGILRLSEAITRSGTDTDPAVLTVPIHMQERSIGLLEIIDETPYRDWSEDERRLVEEIADQLSLALENARLFAQTQKALDETETQAQRLASLNEMSEQLSRASHLDEVFAIAGRKTATIIPSDRVSLALTERDGHAFSITPIHDEHGLTSANGSLPLEEAAIELAIRKRALIMMPGNQENGNLALSAVMAAPLLVSGKLIGTINIGRSSIGGYGKQDENLLLQVASLLASTIEGRRLLEQTEQALSETEALFQAGAELNSVQTFDDILSILRRYTIVGDQARHAAVFLFDQPWQDDQIPAWQNRIAEWSNSALQKGASRLPLSEWKAAPEVLHPEVPTIIPELRANPVLWAEDSPMRAELGTAKSALIIPLNVSRQWIGYIFASYAEPRDFPGVNIRRLTSLAGQAAVAIENLRLLEETMNRARQLQTAAEIARDASETLAVEELLNRAVKLIADRFGFYHTSIYLLDETGKNAVISASGGQAGLDSSPRTRTYPVGSKSVVGYVTQTGPLVLNDVKQSPIHEPNPDLPKTRAELGIPLKVGERIIGALDVQSTRENPFTPDDVAVLQTLTDQIAVAVDNARSYEVAQEAVQEARQRLQELSMLYGVSQSFASAPLEIAEIANLVARQFVKLLHVPECAVSILDEGGRALQVLVAIRINDQGEFLDLENIGQIVPVADYPGSKQALDTLSPLVVNLTSIDVDPDLQTRLTQEGYTSQVIIPLAAKGQPIGIIELKSQRDEHLNTPGVLNLAMTLANQAAVALENAYLYNEQRRTAEQLREVDTLKSQFLANMSHELRTPLNSIIGFSRVILKGIDGPVTNLQEQDLTAIYNAGQHLLGLINDILDLSKIEAGKMELSFEIINLVDLINSVMSTAVGLVKHKPIQLLKDLPKDLPPVNADPLRIRQVLLNLLSNAAKFTDEGSITVSARLLDEAKDGKPQVIVDVIDTGPGISSEDQQKLFQPFTQVDASPTRKTGGSGLGLSISLHLIEMHGGQILVQSEPEKGSTFSFTLSAVDPDALDGQVPRPINYIRQTGPLPALPEKNYDKGLIIKETGELKLPRESKEEPEPQEIPVDNAPEPLEGTLTTQKTADGAIILAVDKDPQIVGLYDRYLQPAGYQVIPSSDAEQAMIFARANKPALITLDVMGGQYDGWKLLQELKEDPETYDIPVVVCSIIEDREKAAALGANDYLVKPILESDLIEAVEKLVYKESPAQIEQQEDIQPIDVLIVDQDTDDIRVLRMLLQEHGYFEVSEAADGRQALEAILMAKPDVIILNHLLTDMDAVTFIRTLRANPTIRGLPIILLTETELPEVMKQQLARNCLAIFHKAKINPAALLASLREAVPEN